MKIILLYGYEPNPPYTLLLVWACPLDLQAEWSILYNPTSPIERQMSVKIVSHFVARHALRYGEWVVEMRETRGQKLLCVSVNSQPIQ